MKSQDPHRAAPPKPSGGVLDEGEARIHATYNPHKGDCFVHVGTALIEGFNQVIHQHMRDVMVVGREGK